MTINEIVENPELTAWGAKIASAKTWKELIGETEARRYDYEIKRGLPLRVGQNPKFPLVMGVTSDYGETYRFDEYVKAEGSTPEGEPDWCGNYMRKDGKHFIVESVNGVKLMTTPEEKWRENFAENW